MGCSQSSALIIFPIKRHHPFIGGSKVLRDDQWSHNQWLPSNKGAIRVTSGEFTVTSSNFLHRYENTRQGICDRTCNNKTL